MKTKTIAVEEIPETPAERLINPGFVIMLVIVSYILTNLAYNNYSRTDHVSTGAFAQLETFYVNHVALF